MKVRLDMDKIARGLGAERRGKVAAAGGYLGALQLLADIEARFRVPSGGGRSTDSSWTERRLVPLAPRTLKRLEEIAAKVRAQGGVSVEPIPAGAKPRAFKPAPERDPPREPRRSIQKTVFGSSFSITKLSCTCNCCARREREKTSSGFCGSCSNSALKRINA